MSTGLTLILIVFLCGAALADNAPSSAVPAAGAVAAKSAEPPRSLLAVEPPLELGEKRVKTPPDGTTIEKFLVYSEAMDRNIHVAVVLPPAYAATGDQRFPVLYALHGHSASYSVFSDMAPLRAALRSQPMLVVSFDGDIGGWYIDSTVRRDSQFETFFFKELIPYIEKNYKASPEARARAVTGFSMGGFGAFHYLLVHPEMFASVSSLSGAFKERPIPDLLGDPARSRAAYDRIAIYPGLEAALAKGIHLPPLYLTCGTEDHLIAESRDLRDWLTAKHVAVEYLEKPGVHDWAFWKGCSAAIIDFHWRTFQGNYKPVEHPAAKAAEGTK